MQHHREEFEEFLMSQKHDQTTAFRTSYISNDNVYYGDEVEEGEEEPPVHMRQSLSPITTMYRPRRCRRFVKNYGSFAVDAYKNRDLVQSEEGHPFVYGGAFQSFKGHNTYLRNTMLTMSSQL